MAKNLKEQKEIEKLVGQLNEAVYAGKVMSLALLYVDSTNGIQVSFHCTEGQAIMMMGLTKLLDQNISTSCFKITKPKDYME